MDINKIETILKNFSKPIKKSIGSSTTTNENIGKISASDDKSFEDNVRRVLKEYFNLKEHDNEMISSNEEFVFYKMDLFKYDDKELITSEYFDKDSPYFCIIRKVDNAETNEILKEGETKKDFEEYFIINNNDLSIKIHLIIRKTLPEELKKVIIHQEMQLNSFLFKMTKKIPKTSMKHLLILSNLIYYLLKPLV